MLTLEELISEATALPDAGKAILIDKIVESMVGEIDSSACAKGDKDILVAGVQKAQERLAKIDSCKDFRSPELAFPNLSILKPEQIIRS
jgi:hypothetical protein